MGEIEAVLNPDAWYSIYYSKPLSERYDYAETWPGAKAANGHDYAPRIYMNFTRELSTDLYQPQYTTWGRMWAFSGQCSPDGNQLKCDVSEKENKVCISVETVLLHELGHMLGLAHPRSNGCNGSIPSIMTSNTNLGESFNQSVQLADKCAIRNIYCPDALTSFDDLSRPANMVEVYPNPTKSGVMLEYPRSWQVKRIIVYNELGEVTTKIWVNNHEVPTFITEKCFSRGINYIVLAKDDMCVVKEVWVR